MSQSNEARGDQLPLLLECWEEKQGEDHVQNGPSLEVHYYLRDGLHSMDALVRNRCEAEFLTAVSYIVRSLGAELQFEATVPTEGGFRDIWRVLVNKDNQSVVVPALTAILTAVLAQAVAVWNAPAKPDKELERQQLEINRLTIENWKLQNQRSELELKKLQRELNAVALPSNSHPVPAPPTVAPSPSSMYVPAPPVNPKAVPVAPVEGEPKRLNLQMDPQVNKHRSTFYKQLIPYERVTAVGFRWLPDDQLAPEERIISRSEFSGFVLHTDTLEPEVAEAVIEIVSPVISEGNMQWKGRWNGQTISFAMDDKVFKDQVFHKAVSFQHGDSIRCVLESERKLDDGGKPKVTCHRVTTVLEKIESGGKPYETPQGRRKRFEDKHADGQSDLFNSERA